MGWLSNLFGEKPQRPSNVDIAPDAVWLTAAAKWKGVRQDLVRKSNSRSAAILLVAHFGDVQAELESLLEDYQGEVPALVVRASDLSSSIAANFEVDENTVIDLIVAERHPLVSEDERVLAGFADDLPCRCRVTYHVSLDDGLMEMFAGANVRNILTKLGMQEDECIESNMVQRRIKQAQNKLTKAATGNRPAETAKQWLDLNVPHKR